MNAMVDQIERLLDQDEIGRRLGVAGRTVREWSRVGRFVPATMIGTLPRWREADVNQWIAARAAREADIAAAAVASLAPRRKRD